MNDIVNFENLNEIIHEVRGHQVLLDTDIARIYHVETKRVNEAVKNNPEKFPPGYTFLLTDQEVSDLRSKFSTTNFSKTRVNPKVFSEKGLYMLATILKGPRATVATLAIIETFSNIRELSKNIKKLSLTEDKNEQKNLLQQSGNLMKDIFNDDLATTDTETTLELNFAMLKFKHTIKKKQK